MTFSADVNVVENEYSFLLGGCRPKDLEVNGLGVDGGRSTSSRLVEMERMGGREQGVRRSPSTSSRDGEDGGVENKSSMAQEIVVERLLEKLVELLMCSPMVERMVDREEKKFLD
ncbi:hypothetical protein Tco_1097988 [Tanacetum coccineum]